MALIGRLFVILFGFLAACLVAGMIVVGAVLFPEFSDLGQGPVDSGALNIIVGFGFIFVSGFALVPAMVVAAITEAFYIRGALTYAMADFGVIKRRTGVTEQQHRDLAAEHLIKFAAAGLRAG